MCTVCVCVVSFKSKGCCGDVSDKKLTVNKKADVFLNPCSSYLELCSTTEWVFHKSKQVPVHTGKQLYPCSPTVLESDSGQVPLPIRVYSTCRNSWVVSWRMWKVHHCSISSIFHHLSPPLTFWPLVHWTGWGWRSGWSQWPLKCHVELCDQEVHVVSVFGLEGLGDDARGFSVLSAPERHAVHLQDHLAHFKLTTVVSWTSPLTMEKKERERERSEKVWQEIIAEMASRGFDL